MHALRYYLKICELSIMKLKEERKAMMMKVHDTLVREFLVEKQCILYGGCALVLKH